MWSEEHRTERYQRMFLIIIVVLCFVTGCAQSTATSKLIAEINAANANVRKILDQAERKRADAGAKRAAGEDSEDARLITEAAKHYGEMSEILKEMAAKADEVAKVRDPQWYSEYFTLHSKRFRKLAVMAAAANEELLVRRDGMPTEAQLKSWKEDLEPISKEAAELWEKIKAIEAREKVGLIK
jgi:chromosome segregation ATPase